VASRCIGEKGLEVLLLLERDAFLDRASVPLPSFDENRCLVRSGHMKVLLLSPPEYDARKLFHGSLLLSGDYRDCFPVYFFYPYPISKRPALQMKNSPSLELLFYSY